jgi:cytidylate kinase
MVKKRMIIAIDGPAGAGKSTLAGLLAQKLGYLHIESGALYRALTHKALTQGVNFHDLETLAELASQTDIVLKSKPHEVIPRVYLDEQDITTRIRTLEVTKKVPELSQIPKVRKCVTKLQRRVARSGGVVIEGRDIGTVVFPDAEVKFYLDASPEVRASREYQMAKREGLSVDPKKIKEDMDRRDIQDKTRKVSPLRKAPDAITIDSTTLSINSVLRIMLKEIKKASRGKKWPLYDFICFIGRPLFKVLFRIEGHGGENIPAEGPVIVVSNHLSYLDPPVLGLMIKRRLNFMAKGELFDIPILSWLIRHLKTFPVKRGQVSLVTMRRTLKLLVRGEVVLIFPEGMRSPNGQLQEPMPGVGILAWQSKASVVPALIVGSNKALPLRARFLRFRKIDVYFGKPINLSSIYSQPPSRQIYQEISELVMSHIAQLKLSIEQ